MRFSAAYLSTAIPPVPFIFSLFPAAHRNTALSAVFFLICFFDEILSACRTLYRIFRFHKPDIQFLIQRQDGGFEPFTNDMRIGDCLRAGAVQQNTNPVIVVTAFTAYKGVYPPALFWGKRYRHSSGGDFLGGFGCPRSPCSFFACSSVFFTMAFFLAAVFDLLTLLILTLSVFICCVVWWITVF